MYLQVGDKEWTLKMGSSSVTCYNGDAKKMAKVIDRGNYGMSFFFHHTNIVFKILKSWELKHPYKNNFICYLSVIDFLYCG